MQHQRALASEPTFVDMQDVTYADFNKREPEFGRKNTQKTLQSVAQHPLRCSQEQAMTHQPEHTWCLKWHMAKRRELAPAATYVGM